MNIRRLLPPPIPSAPVPAVFTPTASGVAPSTAGRAAASEGAAAAAVHRHHIPFSRMMTIRQRGQITGRVSGQANQFPLRLHRQQPTVTQLHSHSAASRNRNGNGLTTTMTMMMMIRHKSTDASKPRPHSNNLPPPPPPPNNATTATAAFLRLRNAVLGVGAVLTVAHVSYDFWYYCMRDGCEVVKDRRIIGADGAEEEEQQQMVGEEGVEEKGKRIVEATPDQQQQQQQLQQKVPQQQQPQQQQHTHHYHYNASAPEGDHRHRLYDWSPAEGFRDLVAFLSASWHQDDGLRRQDLQQQHHQQRVHDDDESSTKNTKTNQERNSTNNNQKNNNRFHWIEEANSFPRSVGDVMEKEEEDRTKKKNKTNDKTAVDSSSSSHSISSDSHPSTTSSSSFPRSCMRLLRLNEKYCDEIETMRIVSYHPPPPLPSPSPSPTTVSTVAPPSLLPSMASLMRDVLTTPGLRKQWDRNYKMFEVVHRGDVSVILDGDESSSSSTTTATTTATESLSAFLPWLKRSSSSSSPSNSNSSSTNGSNNRSVSIFNHLWACHRTCPPFVDKFGFSPWFFMYELMVLEHKRTIKQQHGGRGGEEGKGKRKRNDESPSAYQLLYRSVPPPTSAAEATAKCQQQQDRHQQLQLQQEEKAAVDSDSAHHGITAAAVSRECLQDMYAQHSNLEKDALCHMHRQEIVLIPLRRSTTEITASNTTQADKGDKGTTVEERGNKNTNKTQEEPPLLTQLVDLCSTPEAVHPSFDLIGAVHAVEEEHHQNQNHRRHLTTAANGKNTTSSRTGDTGDSDRVDSSDGGVLMVMTSTNYIPTPRVIPLWAQLFLASKVTEDAARLLTQAAHDYAHNKITLPLARKQMTSGGGDGDEDRSYQRFRQHGSNTGDGVRREQPLPAIAPVHAEDESSSSTTTADQETTTTTTKRSFLDRIVDVCLFRKRSSSSPSSSQKEC